MVLITALYTLGRAGLASNRTVPDSIIVMMQCSVNSQPRCVGADDPKPLELGSYQAATRSSH